MKIFTITIAAAGCLSLTGCASIVSGTHQKVTVMTPPVKGAHCLLTNSHGKWYVKNTPETIVVHRGHESLEIVCKKYGYNSAEQTVQSHFNSMVAGNILVGGIIGAGVDAADGAAYHYPDKILIPMTKVTHKSKTASTKPKPKQKKNK